jgi:hypothetical protein
MSLKIVLRKLANYIFDNLSFFAFIFQINRLSGRDEVVIFDLDNTLVDTYPLLNCMPLKDVFKKVKIHSEMMKLLYHFSEKKVFVFILSARKIEFYGITKNYIKENIKIKVSFFLVSEPSKKIRFLKYTAAFFTKVTLFDDLSYNHENGEVKYYDDIYHEISKLSIVHLGYEEILKINSLISIDE